MLIQSLFSGEPKLRPGPRFPWRDRCDKTGDYADVSQYLLMLMYYVSNNMLNSLSLFHLIFTITHKLGNIISFYRGGTQSLKRFDCLGKIALPVSGARI